MLLRAGAADPEAHHFPGGVSSTPVDSELDMSAPVFAPHQEQPSPQQQQEPQQTAAPQEEHHTEQPAQTAEPAAGAEAEAAQGGGSQAQEAKAPAADTQRTTTLSAALRDAAKSDGPAEADAAAAAPGAAEQHNDLQVDPVMAE